MVISESKRGVSGGRGTASRNDPEPILVSVATDKLTDEARQEFP